MRLCTLVLTLGAALCMANATQAAAFDLVWDGGDGMWYSVDPNGAAGNWNGGQNIINVVGRENGQEGYKDSTGATDILISSGKVSFDGFAISQDFRVLQGSNMTITGGAVWEQNTLDADEAVETVPGFGPLFRWEETRWTEMEMSNLNLDNGTFRRSGGTTFDPTDAGGGALIFGSWKGNDNFGDRDGDLDVDGQDFLDWQINGGGNAGNLRKVLGTYGQNPVNQTSNINITNGGSLENEGQLWLGSDLDDQTNINLNINNGSVTAIGGIDAEVVGGDVPGGDASIVIFDWLGNVNVSIDFTGPGTITTDEGAIRLIKDPGTVTDMTYEDLWNAGILTANGSNAGAFGDSFTVTGNWGDAVYTLTSNVVAASSGISAVPEPTSIMLAGLAVLSLAGVTRRRRA
ncbi:MAG: PEP-CTERM sorting domain-containing protein [Planctomycetes bacterium]|nr:PEP-CTERM sorting domain-containing protein [Planctomycetota bacterium]